MEVVVTAPAEVAAVDLASLLQSMDEEYESIRPTAPQGTTAEHTRQWIATFSSEEGARAAIQAGNGLALSQALENPKLRQDDVLSIRFAQDDPVPVAATAPIPSSAAPQAGNDSDEHRIGETTADAAIAPVRVAPSKPQNSTTQRLQQLAQRTIAKAPVQDGFVASPFDPSRKVPREDLIRFVEKEHLRDPLSLAPLALYSQYTVTSAPERSSDKPPEKAAPAAQIAHKSAPPVEQKAVPKVGASPSHHAAPANHPRKRSRSSSRSPSRSRNRSRSRRSRSSRSRSPTGPRDKNSHKNPPASTRGRTAPQQADSSHSAGDHSETVVHISFSQKQPTPESVRRYLSQFGTVVRLDPVIQRKCFFAEFASHDEARACMRVCSPHTMVDGVFLRFNWKIVRPPRHQGASAEDATHKNPQEDNRGFRVPQDDSRGGRPPSPTAPAPMPVPPNPNYMPQQVRLPQRGSALPAPAPLRFGADVQSISVGVAPPSYGQTVRGNAPVNNFFVDQYAHAAGASPAPVMAPPLQQQPQTNVSYPPSSQSSAGPHVALAGFAAPTIAAPTMQPYAPAGRDSGTKRSYVPPSSTTAAAPSKPPPASSVPKRDSRVLHVKRIGSMREPDIFRMLDPQLRECVEDLSVVGSSAFMVCRDCGAAATCKQVFQGYNLQTDFAM